MLVYTPHPKVTKDHYGDSACRSRFIYTYFMYNTQSHNIVLYIIIVVSGDIIILCSCVCVCVMMEQ